MDCLGILDSGNFAFHLCSILERKGCVIEVVSVPCAIATGGCGYCLKFPEELLEFINNEGIRNGLILREVYRIIPGTTKNRYVRIL